MNRRMEENTLAMELLHQIKSNTKKWFIAFIIVLVMFFASNLAWLYAWNLPVENTTTTYDADSEYSGNAIINDSGEVNVNGKSDKDSQSN